MRWPPYLLKIKFQNRRHAFALWLPLFLIGPIVLVFLLAIFLVLLPFGLLAIIFTWQLGWWRPMLLGVPGLFRLLCYLPGLKVDVEGSGERVFIAFF